MIGGSPRRAEKKFKSLTKLLNEKLREAIISGKFAPGERLAEEALSTSLHENTLPADLRLPDEPVRFRADRTGHGN